MLRTRPPGRLAGPPVRGRRRKLPPPDRAGSRYDGGLFVAPRRRHRIPCTLHATRRMPSPSDRRYSSSHEWFKVDGDVVTIGITRFAADELTDITYVAMKPTGTKVTPGSSVGEVESVKTTSDVYSVVGGEIAEVNGAVAKDPSLVNSDSFGTGWLLRIRTADTTPINALMEASTYDQKHPVG